MSQSQGASAPAVNPIDLNTRCKAIALLDDACAVALYVMLASDDRNDCEAITDTEKRGFHIVMQDMMDRISKARDMLSSSKGGRDDD